MHRRYELAGGEAAGAMSDGSIFFVGTATTLIRFGGFSILTDPNFLHQGEKVHLGYGLHSTRRTEPACQLEDLPPFDFVLLSHLHEDHFDRKVEQRLPRHTQILTTPKAARALAHRGFYAVDAMHPWESIEFARGESRLRVTSMPGRHGPMAFARLLPPVMGSMLEFGHERFGLLLRLYVSGDTLVYEAIREIPERFPGIDCALLHLGGTRVMGVLVTMDGKQGVEMMKIVEPEIAVPIHYDDYDVFRSPLSDFADEVHAAGLDGHVRWIHRGETLPIPNPLARTREAHEEETQPP
ncbi:MBL fold metallo-hydrolase [Vulgatibacter sp.]|uniref:MBL fold metallo-hydrolase n=1 Tax=Vulgatibacter sp. TaxID=1971226 RepID=UPI0035697A09